ncbi:MAG: hypothetical protein J6O00_02455 [Clostridiales bacterium]|nr:hypothetical protein [Clostridiales bacterium]
MGNIGKRERYYLMLLGILVVVLLIYFFGIRNLNATHDELVVTRSQLQAQLDYYEALKTQNDAAMTQINQLNNQISEAESFFMPYVCSEAIEQYVLKTFEDAGCPYLVNVTVEDAPVRSVSMPDGSTAPESLLARRVNVQYSTTDGYNIPEYNRSVSVVSGGVIDEGALNALLEEMYWHGADSIVGYDEFVSALKTLETADPNCIKLSKVSILSEGGYILMSASIDFYSATFRNRVSEPDTSAPYVTWSGSTSINTDGGFIGRPFIIENPASAWFNVIMTDGEATAGNRPFSTYYSSTIFNEEVMANGLEAVLEIGEPAVQPDEIPEE